MSLRHTDYGLGVSSPSWSADATVDIVVAYLTPWETIPSSNAGDGFP